MWITWKKQDCDSTLNGWPSDWSEWGPIRLFFFLFNKVTLNCKSSTDCAVQVLLWSLGRRSFMCVCVSFQESGQLCLGVSFQLMFQQSSKCLHVALGQEKWETWSSFHFKFDLFGACGYVTWFVLFYVGWSEKWYVLFCPSWTGHLAKQKDKNMERF